MKGRPKQIDDTVPEYKVLVTDTIKYFYRKGIMVGSEILDDPYSPFTKLEKLLKKLDKLKEPVYINGRKKRITKEDKLTIEKTQNQYDTLYFELFPEDKPKKQYKKRK
jgi:hypothetical protein